MDTSVADPARTLDLLDRRIVSALQIDGRAETRRIAEVLGVSARTVARRLARMREAGLVRVTRMPDPEGGGAVGALVLRVRVLRGKVETLADALAARPDVPFVDILMGGEEIGAVVVPTAGDRDRLLYRQLPATRAVADSTVHAVLHVYADAAQWRAGWLDEGEVAALTPAPDPAGPGLRRLPLRPGARTPPTPWTRGCSPSSTGTPGCRAPRSPPSSASPSPRCAAGCGG
ncbi:Lrp/AsnC family transcriptional regulator [Streptomyces albireticuli]|uniref:Lrp/AsnC family transcriptional regulator n=1 Tax=Streptomyces albireticuli TaxID=1940 RepID=UPI00367EC769